MTLCKLAAWVAYVIVPYFRLARGPVQKQIADGGMGNSILLVYVDDVRKIYGKAWEGAQRAPLGSPILI